MDSAAWIVISVFSAGLAILLALTFVPSFARWSVYRSAAELRVGLPARLERSVGERLMVRQRGGTIGGLVLTALAVAALRLDTGVDLGVADEPGIAFWYVAGAALAGIGAGTAIAALTGTPRIATDEPRVARSNAVTVADYISPVERIGSRVIVVVAVAAVIAVTVALRPLSGGPLLPIVVSAVLGAVSLVLFEVSSRRIIALPQPAGSTAELVWDDAVRVSALRDMLAAPVAFGLYSLVFSVAVLVQAGVDQSAPFSLDALSIGSPIVVIALTAYSSATGPKRYFLHRLWPKLRWSDTADEQAPAATDAV